MGYGRLSHAHTRANSRRSLSSIKSHQTHKFEEASAKCAFRVISHAAIPSDAKSIRSIRLRFAYFDFVRAECLHEIRPICANSLGSDCEKGTSI